jgi:C-terminal processing protease CtpA/Prc
MPLTREHRQALLAKIDELVTAKYYDPSYGGNDWKAIVSCYRDEILDAGTCEEFETSVAALLRQLPSAELGLLGPSTKIQPRSSINASFRAVLTNSDGLRWVFQDVLPGGVAAHAGVRSGDALLSLAGATTGPPEPPSFPMNERLPITISRGGAHHELELNLSIQKPKYKSNPYSEPNGISTALRSRDVGIMKVGLFPGFLGVDFANEVTRHFARTFASIKRLLIDLRGNPGGGIGGLRIMSHLIPSRVPIGYSVDRPTAERGYEKEQLPRFHHIPRFKWELPLLALRFYNKKSVVLETEGCGRQPFHGRVVVLCNEHSSGAAEMLAQFAKENQLATIVGTRTPGHLISRSAFPIGHGYQLVVPVAAYKSWQGTQIEGNGIEPDLDAPWSYEAALEQRDSQLEQAVRVLESL